MNRTRKSLLKHKSNVDNCGLRWKLIVQSVEGRKVLIPVATKCHSRFCIDCSKLKRFDILNKFRYFRDAQHCVKLELTFDNSAPDPYEDPRFYSHAWDVFVKRLRRYIGKIHYLRIVELSASGRPHFHILIDRFIPHEWITSTFPECGGGKVNWIKLCDPGRAFGYITKYITKGLNGDESLAEFFYLTGMRQYSASQHLYFRVPKKNNFYVVEGKPNTDLESMIREHRHDHGSYLVSLSDIGSGPPDIFLYTQHPPAGLFDYPACFHDLDRADLLLMRYDLNSWQAKSRYPVFN
jgi:hypothetical protein